jgi:dimethylargininase
MSPAPLPFALPRKVVVRPVSAGYARCVRVDASVAIDVGRARAQHEAYVAAVRELGVAVGVVPTDEACPDSCFIEDTAVVTGAHALATCPGAASRRAEVGPVAEALAGEVVVHRMEAPATLDGGDVLRVGARLFVGLSSRTNEAGAEALAHVAARDGLEVVRMRVRDGLHLKSACSLASAELVVYDARVLTDEDVAVLRESGIRALAAPEPAGANVLALGHAVLASAAAPRTVELLRAEGLDVRVVDVGEMHKGDGALTCLSLRIPGAGAWST